MLQIRYSPPNEVDISGSPKDLHDFKNQLLDFLRSSAKDFSIETDAKVNPAPYLKVIPKLQFSKTDSPTKISILSDAILSVEGSVENLDKFSSWFNFPLDAKHGAHGHYDWFEGNKYVDKNSLPIVVGVL